MFHYISFGDALCIEKSSVMSLLQCWKSVSIFMKSQAYGQEYVAALFGTRWTVVWFLSHPVGACSRNIVITADMSFIQAYIRRIAIAGNHLQANDKIAHCASVSFDAVRDIIVNLGLLVALCCCYYSWLSLFTGRRSSVNAKSTFYVVAFRVKIKNGCLYCILQFSL